MLTKTTYKPAVRSQIAVLAWECYRPDCTQIAVSRYMTHSGAHLRACLDHSGTCHTDCWLSDPYFA